MYFYKKLNIPKILSFDLDDTLYDNSQVIINAEKRILDIINNNYLEHFTLSIDLYEQQKISMYNKYTYLNNDVSLGRFFVVKEILLKDKKNENISTELAKKIVNDFIKIRSEIFVPRETNEILKKLSSKYKIIAISNGNADISNLEISKYISKVFNPNIYLPAKPNIEIFNYVINYFGITNKDLCHIGDDEYTDILGANRANINSIWQTQYRRNDKSLKILPNVRIDKIEELLDLLM